MGCLAKDRTELGAISFGICEFVFGACDHAMWHRWFIEKFAADPVCSSLPSTTTTTWCGRKEVDRAMLNAAAKFPEAMGSTHSKCQ